MMVSRKRGGAILTRNMVASRVTPLTGEVKDVKTDYQDVVQEIIVIFKEPYCPRAIVDRDLVLPDHFYFFLS